MKVLKNHNLIFILLNNFFFFKLNKKYQKHLRNEIFEKIMTKNSLFTSQIRKL